MERYVDITNLNVLDKSKNINFIEKFDELRTGLFPMFVNTEDFQPGHSLIGLYTHLPFHNNFALEECGNLPYKIIKLSFFIPTSGFGDIDHLGRFGLTWKLQDPQIDFLLEIFDNIDKLGNVKIVIDFFDESPDVYPVFLQVHEIARLYDIPTANIIFMGHNFFGQRAANEAANELGELPFRYIVDWDMSTHMDTESLIEQKITRLKNINNAKNPIPSKT